ncbi:putative GNAT-family acetyltransferase [Xylaria bambusicola]|uniref:putative GNAT-family acetyltransferase n=1 Tax=Xylaria bambusicola TaxID=326684 RepID=UPI0020088AC1|nr:putative GNAT-family acetyltransferase [Xylaria bambusicola]KAI0509645.1 putative GNAT-family acetyltransferase [Xylaria bambusicola]
MGSKHHAALGPIVGQNPALYPSLETKLSGRYVSVVGMSSEDILPLYPHISGDENAHAWDYMFDGPFQKPSDFEAVMKAELENPELIIYAIISADQPITPNGTHNIIGCASYNHSDPKNRTVEVGVLMSPKVQRTPATTEAMYLMAKHAFEDLGYRRYEWKCDSLNTPSYKAALRLGFTFEGTFRQHMIIKGRNRDTAWFSIVDGEWPAIKSAFEAWLDPPNFDESGLQRKRLEDFRNK